MHEGTWGDPRPRDNQWTEGLAEVLHGFADRYQRPVFLSETCLPGTVEGRIRWMDASIETVIEGSASSPHNSRPENTTV